ncbi:MAG: DUF2917 domain-containing protein [Holophaga sp.]|nr:DUF2917 domain-containing protein [Holophaga sp.]
MFQALVDLQARNPVAGHGLGRAHASPREAGASGIVDYQRPAAFANLKGRMVRCDSGHLWITLENDPVDHVLDPGQCLAVPTPGKVVVGGKGGFTTL